ncbi:GntR family transcriptional regulator [Polymorphobacter sp.]|uniref:GntR family transcriptional regulator n=1 Tax=Polymorphobacter sp. TaxID=1909290 RepID=UPI003F72DEC7
MRREDDDRKQNGISQYLLIAETIKGWITSGRYKAGDSIATVGEMAQQFGVARGTIQEALRELSGQGVIVTSRGKRSTVRQAPQLRPVFAKMDLGDLLFVDQVGADQSEYKSIRELTPDDELRKTFGFSTSENLIELRHLAFLNGRPNAYVISYIPARSGTVPEDASTEDYQAQFRRIINGARHMERRASALTADPEISSMLEIPVGTAVLRYRCIIWRNRRQLDLYYEAFLRSDDCEYRLDA